MNQFFEDFDLNGFWEDSEYATHTYVEPQPTDALIAEVEAELGYKLPESYIALMRRQNGGIPRNTCFPTDKPTSWAADHVAISGIMGIGRTKQCSLGGEFGAKFMAHEWGYPNIGICICDCPSAGHDMIMLDYRACGPMGEPGVVHVDQEIDYRITFLAPNFETFIRGLVNCSVYDTSAADLKRDLAAIDAAPFSPLLAELIGKCEEADFGSIIRSLCRSITIEKGYFALHADEKSYLMYDIQFYLYANAFPEISPEEFLRVYPRIIALADGEFGIPPKM